MGEQLSIRTLGGVILERDGKLITSFDTRKTVALLVYLACTGRQHPRETIAEMFWEERSQSESLNRLRPSLTYLRKTVGPYVIINRDSLAMNTSSNWWLDTHACESLVSSNNAQQLSQAIDLYQGEFLEGFYVDSQAFEDWRLIEAERLHYAALDGFDRLVDYHLSNGSYAEGLKIAMHLLRLDTLRERTYHQLMRLLAQSGQREAALKQYETCRRLLHDELGVEPTSETMSLYQQIRDGHLIQVRPRTSAPAEAVDVALVRHIDDVSARSRPPARLIGREPLMDEIEQWLAEGEHVLLQGFAGAGKTAIAATVVARRLAQGAGPILWIQAGHQSGDEILEAIAACFSASGPLPETFEARVRAVTHLLGDHGVRLVVIDDSWNGEALDQVSPAVPSNVPVIVTSRHRFPLFQLIQVPRLDRPAALEVLSFYAQQNWSNDREADDLCQTLRDLPFALRIAGIRLALDELTPQELVTAIVAAPHEMTMPAGFERKRESLAALLQTSLQALDPFEHRVLMAFGQLFSPGATADLLSLIVDQDEHLVLESLRKLQHRGLVEGARHPDSDIVYYGIHDLAYGYVRSQVPPDHAQQGAVIEACRAFAARHTGNVALLHCERTNILRAAEAACERRDDASLVGMMRALVVDGEYFSARGHDSLLLDQLDRAINAARRLGDDQAETLHYLLGKRGNAYYERGKLEEAIVCYQEAGELAHVLGMINRQILALCVVSKVLSKLDRAQDAEAGLEQAYTLAIERGEPASIAHVLENWAVHAYDHGNFEKARALSMEEVQLVGKEHLQRRFFGLLNWGASEHKLNKFEKSISLYEEALGIASAEDDHNLQAHALYGLAETYLEMRAFRKAGQYLSKALNLFESSGNISKVNELLALQERLPVNERHHNSQEESV